MESKKKRLAASKLYLILDDSVNSFRELLRIAEAAFAENVGLVQIRAKQAQAREILEFCQKLEPFRENSSTLFIMNDRVDLALAARADGVHLGQEDLPVACAREMLGKDALVGRSCQTYQHVLEAQREGADYIGFGSVFKTQTKPDRAPMDLNVLKKVIENVSVPLFAIGGIDLKNVSLLKPANVQRVAVCRAVCGRDDIKTAIKEFQSIL